MNLVTRAFRLLRARTAFLGRGVQLGPRPCAVGRLPYVRNLGSMRIGARFNVRGLQFRSALTTGPRGSIVLGDDVLLNQGATIHSEVSVTVGSNVFFADLSAVYDTDFHALEPGRDVREAPVVIGDNVWIGRGAVVMPGVTIGEHSVVAAGSIVTQDVSASTLVAGVPARLVKALQTTPAFRRQ